MDNLPEDRYESINMIIKCRADRQTWFDIISDHITQDCQGDTEPDEEGNFKGCTCGLESMGGSAGTLQQCFDQQENVGQGLKLIDLARAIIRLSGSDQVAESDNKVIAWAYNEIDFEENWNDPIEDEEEAGS